MDIKGVNNNLRPDTQTEGVKGRDSARQGSDLASEETRGNAAGEESVTLTNAARAMNAATEPGETPPFDSNRVAALREALANGNYPIDTNKLADRMIDLERLLR